ncbi:unnamed protein product [Urochloa humidicola]
MGAWLSTTAPASPSSWPALPPELTDLILRRLSSHADRIRFASVCRQWHHAAAHFRGFFNSVVAPARCYIASLMASSTPPYAWNLEDHTQYSCLGASGRWLLFKGPKIWPNYWNTLVRNPLTGATVQLRSFFSSAAIDARKVTVCSPELIAAI